MSLELKISVIEELSVARWADNWNFRAYLRKHQSTDQVDSTVHRLNLEIAPQIDCTKCANCCHVVSPHLTDADVVRVARAKNINPKKFSQNYLESDGEGEQIFRARPCPLLVGSRCGTYDDRPEDCRSYPHLHRPDFVKYSISTIENYRVCPIVFNVYERLKKEFPYDPAVDYIGDEEQE